MQTSSGRNPKRSRRSPVVTELAKSSGTVPRRPNSGDSGCATRVPGVYQLHLHLSQAVRLKVGRLGTFLFPAGDYVYTGSALNGLEQRLTRHRRRRKKRHWHIDYLLEHAHIEDIAVKETRQRLECSWNARVLRQPGAVVVAKGFGSSDCRCPTHLVHLPTKTAKPPDTVPIHLDRRT